MASAGDIHSILYKGGDVLKQKEPTYDASRKVKRYFSGKVPEFVVTDNGNDDDFFDTRPLSEQPASKGWLMDETDEVVNAPKETQTGRPLSTHERRLRQLAAIEQERASAEPAKEEAIPEDVPAEQDLASHKRRRRHREVIEQGTLVERGASVASDSQPPRRRVLARPLVLTVASVDLGEKAKAAGANEEPDTVRERVRAAALELRRKEEEDVLGALAKKKEERSGQEEVVPFGNAKEEDTGPSDDEEDDEDDVERPLFIPASARAVLREQRENGSEMDDAEVRKKELEKRKKESKQLLVSIIANEEEEERQRLEAREKGASWNPEDMPDDDDTVNEEAEYELWKIREMKRIIRRREEAAGREAFLATVERRRHMTEEERREDDRRLDLLQPKKETSSKYTFMQKYYHKGAFFQDLAQSGKESLYLRDVNVPVGGDVVDKKLLPKPMQLRRGQFGKAGQVKHTHLAAVDTTDYSSAWYQSSSLVQKTTQAKMAGYKGQHQLERPSKNKKN